MTRTNLQTTADSAAHAAIMARETESFSDAILAAQEVTNSNMMWVTFLVISMYVGAVGIDYSNGVMTRTNLQTTADSAAHAAIMTSETESLSDAILAAQEVTNSNMPADSFGEVMKTTDVEVGHWDSKRPCLRRMAIPSLPRV